MKGIILAMTVLVLIAACVAVAEERNRLSLYYSYLHWNTDLSQLADDGTLDLELASATEQKINQGVLGLNATGVLSQRFHIDLGGTLANTTAQLEYDNSANNYKRSLSSLNDTRLRFTYTFGEGKGEGSLFFNLPTGKRELTTVEYGVTTQIADVARKFMVRRYGQGLDIGFDWYAQPHWENFGLRAGGGYLHRGKYQALKSDPREYKYGDEIFGTLGFNFGSRPIRGSLGAVLRYYMKDKYDGNEVFQAGVATTVNGAITYSDSYDITLGALMLLRGKAKVRASGVQVLSDEKQKSGRDQLSLYANGSFPTTERMRLLGRLEFVNVSANDYSRESPEFLPKSYYLGMGGGFGYALTGALSASTMVSYYMGQVDSELDLTGLGLTFVLTLQPGQGR